MIASLDILNHDLAFVGRLFEPVSPVDQIRRIPFIIVGVLDFALAAACFAFWRRARDFPIFGSMCLYLALFGIYETWIYCGGIHSGWAIVVFISPLFPVIAGQALQVPYRLWIHFAWPVSVIALLFGWPPTHIFIRFLPLIVSEIFLPILIVQSFRRLGSNRLVTGAFVVMFASRLIAVPGFLQLVDRFRSAPIIRAYSDDSSSFDVGPYRWPLNPIILTIVAAITLVVFVNAFARDRAEKIRLASELESARAIQQVLIPASTPQIRGFSIESVYRPYGELGGDFFQILPQPGGALIAIGDVSGKGLPAALLVSVLVGALQTLAEKQQAPAQIMAALNRRVLDRSQGGFTTCLCAHIASNGSVILANAGHLPPYLNGKEIVLENGLPLGLSVASTYLETTLILPPGAQLTLLTDGVIEARNAQGELFGFERAAAISTEPAQNIARAASTFGQDDDITVLTLQFAPAEVVHA